MMRISDFILNGFASGFDIIDPEDMLTPTEMDNHPSASSTRPLYSEVAKQVLVEIEEGNYIVTDTKPELIIPLGAIPKPDGGIRLIHDCSRTVI
jgi:hypothetical protein